MQIIDAYTRHRPQLIVVENNASQSAISQWAIEKGHQLPIMPFATGINKVSPDVGLPSMDVEFANGSWLVAMGGLHEPDCVCGFCTWKREMDEHPIGVAADTVMAAWFAREGARALQCGVLEGETQETYTAEDVGLPVVTIGGDY